MFEILSKSMIGNIFVQSILHVGEILPDIRQVFFERSEFHFGVLELQSYYVIKI